MEVRKGRRRRGREIEKRKERRDEERKVYIEKISLDRIGSQSTAFTLPTRTFYRWKVCKIEGEQLFL